MSVLTARPNATDADVGPAAVTGAASVHAALSDDSDSSYITIPIPGYGANYVYVGCDEPALPSGAVVKSLAMRLRTALPAAGAGTFACWANFAETLASHSVTVTWTSPTTLATPPTALSAWPATNQIAVFVGQFTPSTVRIYEAYLDLTYVEKPALTVDSPSGTEGGTNEPTVVWTNTLDSDGGAQTRFQVKVFDDATYSAGGFDPASSSALVESGITSSAAASWQVTDTLPDDTYRAYVRVAQTVNGALHWSDWEHTEFTIDVVEPDAARLTLTANADLGRVELYAVGEATGDAAAQQLEFQRSVDGGTTWEPLRLTTDSAGVVDDPEAEIADYEMPLNTSVSYRVRALRAYGSVTAASAWTTDTVTVTTRQWWLKHPLSPALSQAVTVVSYAAHQRPARHGVFQPLGRTDQVVIGDTRSARRGQLVVRVDTTEARDALDTLLAAGATFLLHGPVNDHEPDRYIRITDEQHDRIADKAFVAGWHVTLTWFEVATPTGVVDEFPGLGFWTIGDMEAAYAGQTLADLEGDYTDLYDLEHVEAP